MPTRYRVLLLLAVFAMLPPASATGQRRAEGPYSLVVRGGALGETLETLARLTEIDLVYSSALVGDKRAYCAGRAVPAETLLRCILRGTGLDYVRSSSGTYVLIEAVQEGPRFGGLAGHVVDAETGQPLPYASVLLADAGGGTVTNADGLFSFATLVTGRHRVVVTYVGYTTARDSVWVEMGTNERLRIALTPAPVALKPVIIDGLAQRLPSEGLGAGTVADKDFATRTVLGTPDVARGAAHLPGVAAQQPLADLHIQGGDTGEHLTLLDGAAVRAPVSLGRHLSAFSPLALDRLTVHKAGFDATHGSHLSGVLALEHSVGAARRVSASLDPVSLNAKIESRFPLPGAARAGALMLAFRTSVWDLYRDRGVGALLRHWNTVDPQLAARWIDEAVNTASLDLRHQQPLVGFSDAHAAVRLHLGAFQTLHASVYRAHNRLGADLTARNANPATPDDHLLLTRDDYEWDNWAGQVRLSRLLGARSVLSVQATGSWHDSYYDYHALNSPTPASEPTSFEETVDRLLTQIENAPGSYEGNHIREMGLRGVFTHSLGPHRQVEFGVEGHHAKSQFGFGNAFIASVRHATAAWEGAAYGKATLALGPATTLEPSLRLTYLPLRGVVYAEPRLALRHDAATGPLGAWAARVAGGLYRQYVNQFELSSAGTTSVVPSILFWLPLDETMAPPRAYHLAAELLVMPSAGWTVRLEAYGKHQPRLLTLDYVMLLAAHPALWPAPRPVVLAQSAFISPTEGRAFGAGGRLDRDGDRLDLSLGYSYSHAARTFPGRFGGRRVTVPWNVPHRLTADAEVTLRPGLTAHLGGQYLRGRRWAFRRAYYDYLALTDPVLTRAAREAGPFDLDAPDAHRLAPYVRLDAGLTYRQTFGAATLQAQAFVINLLDRHNVYDRSLDPTADGFALAERTLPGRYPAFALRVTY